MIEALLKGLPVTMTVTALGSLVCIATAVIAGFGRMSRFWIVKASAGCFIEFFRGSNILIQLYVVYYVLPLWGMSLSPFVASVAVIGLNCGAYGAEAVRGAIMAVPIGQRDAAQALNFSRWNTFRRVVLPQAVVVFLPSLGALLVDLLKNTSIVSLVTLVDITFAAQQLRLSTGNTPLVYFAALLVYYLLATLIDIGVKALEKRSGRFRALNETRSVKRGFLGGVRGGTRL